MSLTTEILPEASTLIWRELQKLAKPLMGMINKAARSEGLDPNYLAWLVRSGEHWPRIPGDQAQVLRLAHRLLLETGVGQGRFTPPTDLLSDEQQTDKAFQSLGQQMPLFKKMVADAYVKGLTNMIRRVKEWRKSIGGPPWSDNDARMFLHGVLQDELKTGARGINKPVLLWEAIQTIS